MGRQKIRELDYRLEISAVCFQPLFHQEKIWWERGMGQGVHDGEDDDSHYQGCKFSTDEQYQTEWCQLAKVMVSTET